MKLLLTSNGICNQSIANALQDLVGKSFVDTKIAFIPTAANTVTGSKNWLINDLKNIQNLDVKMLDIVDIAALTKEQWLPRLKDVDIIVVGGGDPEYLHEQAIQSGFATELLNFLETKVYVGISAGSRLTNPCRKKIFRALDHAGHKRSNSGFTMLGLVDFFIIPHLNSKHFPKRTIQNITEVANQMTEKLYTLDDESAIKVDGDSIEVISEGEWEVFN